MSATEQAQTIQERIEAKLEPIEENNNLAEADEGEAIEEEVLETETEDAEPEDVEDSDDSTDDDSEEDQDAPDDDVVSYELSDIAQLLGVDESVLDVDEDGKVIAKTKVDGQEGIAKLNDLIKSHQLEGHLNKQNMEVVEQRKALEQQQQEFAQKSQAQLKTLEDSLTLAYNQLNNEFQGINWNELKQSDPATYAAYRRDFDDRQQQISYAYQNLEQTRQAQRDQLRQQGVKNLFDAIPEWKDADAREKGRSELKNGLAKHYGYSNEELAAVIDQGMDISGLDHRIYLMARDALKYRQLQDGKPEVTKKVKTASKTVKAGSPQKSDKKTVQIKKARQAVKNSGGKQGVAEYLMQKGIV